MKKKVIIAVIAALMLTLGVLNRHPITICDMDLPEGYLEAAKSQAAGAYSKNLPLVPVIVTIDDYSDDVVEYTIHYFPCGTVGMKYDGDTYSIEKQLTGLS